MKELVEDLKIANDNLYCANQMLEQEIKRLNNIIKEAINYIKKESWFCYKDNEEIVDRMVVEKLLEILGSDKK